MVSNIYFDFHRIKFIPYLEMALSRMITQVYLTPLMKKLKSVHYFIGIF